MTNPTCETKSIRNEVIEEVMEKMTTCEIYEDIANLFKTLGDFNRVRILCALNYQEFCVCELSLLLDMSQSAVSHQLRLLRNKNLVKFRKENKQIFYSLRNENIIKMLKKANEYEF